MNSIIRLNAIETSSQAENSAMNFHNLYSYCDLVSEKAFRYESHVASTKAGLPKASTDTHTRTVTNPETASKNTGYWSTSLQALLEQLPLTLAHLVTPKSIAFFTVVVVWAWTGKIEQINQVRGKFVALSEPQKLQLQHLGKVVNTAVEDAQQLKTSEVVAELDSGLLGAEVEVQTQHLAVDQMQFKHIKDLMAQTRMLAQRSASLKAQEKQAGLGALDTLEPQNAEMPVQPSEQLKPSQIQQLAKGMAHLQAQKVQTHLDTSVKRDFSTSSKTAVSIFPTAKPLKKLAQIHRFKVGLAGNYITNKRKIIKLKADQTATAK